MKLKILILSLFISAFILGCGGSNDGEAHVDVPIVPEQPLNQPPVIGGTPHTAVTTGLNYSFVPTASDPDGDSLAFEITNRPNWATFDPLTGALTGTPSVSQAGIYGGIVITVTDGQASTSLPPFNITVEISNSAPQISGTPEAVVTVGRVFSFIPTASDPDGDGITFSIDNKPLWADFDTSTGALTGTPSAANIGTYEEIIISVTDGERENSLEFSLSVEPVVSNLKKTGQTKSYDNNGNEITDRSLRDDGFYQAGITPTYTRSNDIVTDQVTGLMWQDNAEAAAIDKKSLQEAMDYCNDLSLGGYTDWRLPNIKELETIIDYGRYAPAIDPVFNNITMNSDYDNYYWSSSMSYIDAYVIEFYYGSSDSIGGAFSLDKEKVIGEAVRCVRGEEQTEHADRFERNDDIVIDRATGLMWQDDAASIEERNSLKRNWEEEIDYCESLELGGYNDWRLPNSRELISIHEFSEEIEFQMNEIFRNNHSGQTWYSSSTSGAGSQSSNWTVDFTVAQTSYYFDGFDGKIYNKYSGFVRCVRSGQ